MSGGRSIFIGYFFSFGMKREDIKQRIKALAERYRNELAIKLSSRNEEMESDDNGHYLIYQVLGISDKEGKLIDVYQNRGRFLYKYAGSFLEEASILCFEEKYPKAKRKLKIKNTLGSRPSTFEIDCLHAEMAFDIKWKDATPDGDHITKEHTRIKVIKKKGYTPIRIMFYYPNRDQAKRIQDTIKTLYEGLKGHYYSGDKAWEYLKKHTDIDLKEILEEIAKENTKNQSSDKILETSSS